MGTDETSGGSGGKWVAIAVAVIGAIGAIVVAVIQHNGSGSEAPPTPPPTTTRIANLKLGCSENRLAAGASLSMRFAITVTGSKAADFGLGATLGQAQGDDRFDGAGDIVVPLEIGSNTVERPFRIAPGVSAGRHTLTGEVWDGEPGAEGRNIEAEDFCTVTVTHP